jgi:hypothetical protein
MTDKEQNMDQNNPNDFKTGTTGSTGTGSTSSGSSFATGGTGTGMGSGGGMSTGSGTGAASFDATSAQSAACPTCGATKSGGLEQFLGRLGINEEMMNNLKGQFQNVDIDEYLNTAREYLKDSSSKASGYAKENPGRVAAGVAALALGAGLIYAAANRDKE